ncbi:Thioredoxin-like 1-1, chloroplastic [Sesamum angolense]|uniref:Thioredoxin-like 1-1, chloroplastic n=1 Tax=Sesamum angolense TaxID=2727404 RepID=A0AAE1WZ68_9LAMI|nr:Thioredoxin-like 1-1, chloroplastic [Sesamum angolense]
MSCCLKAGFSVSGSSEILVKNRGKGSFRAQASVSFGKALRWWEKSLQPNMIEINSAQELVDSLLNAGDRLVIVDFYSPGCGGCKALHPKICQLAESNPDAVFLKSTMNNTRQCAMRFMSMSCPSSDSTEIKKFKDALAKHGTERCSLGPAKGLDESELLALASIGQISRSLAPKPMEEKKVEDLVLQETAKSSTALGKDNSKIAVGEGNAMAMA